MEHGIMEPWNSQLYSTYIEGRTAPTLGRTLVVNFVNQTALVLETF